MRNLVEDDLVRLRVVAAHPQSLWKLRRTGEQERERRRERGRGRESSWRGREREELGSLHSLEIGQISLVEKGKAEPAVRLTSSVSPS